MKISCQYLSKFLNQSLNAELVAKKLTFAGLEVDDTHPIAKQPVTDIHLATIQSVQANGDGFNVTLSLGNKAHTVSTQYSLKEGQRVVFLKPGHSLLVDEDKKAGAIASYHQLGLEDFDADRPAVIEGEMDGELELLDYLGLEDTIIDIDLTPNRGDCLSYLGICRELSTLMKLPFDADAFLAPHNELKSSSSKTIGATSHDVNWCPMYAGRVIEGIDSRADTPFWIQDVLHRSGIRSTSLVVDVLNYVMIKYGQPMHGFDCDTLDGDIQVRLAEAGEQLTLLDEREVALTENTLIIADEKKPLAIAGVMGGFDSRVTDDTTTVFLESAHFTQEAIAGVARRYVTHTDASYRYERGVDPNLPLVALAHASELIQTYGGGTLGPITKSQAQEFEPTTVEFQVERVEQLLGVSIEEQEILSIFNRLGLTTDDSTRTWQVQVPRYRFDIQLEEDLIEEIARVYGYENLFSQSDDFHLSIQNPSTSYTPSLKQFDALINDGYSECITYSFTQEALQSKLFPETSAYGLLNPISSDLSHMRVSLWPGLLLALVGNQNHQQQRIRLFEHGRCFFPQKEQGVLERHHVAGLATGDLYPVNWSGDFKQPTTFHTVKGDVENYLLSVGFDDIQFVAANQSALHPGQSAAIYVNNNQVGYMGALHPIHAQWLDITGDVFLFELDLDACDAPKAKRFESFTNYPALKRDLSFLIDKDISYQAIKAAVEQSRNELIRNVEIFDLYQGKNCPKEQKSVGLSLTIQDLSRTLIDEEIKEVVDGVIGALTSAFQITMRT